jgi:putative PIN family toxin of toxin-antitoxin system
VNVCLETSIFVGAYARRGRCADVLLPVLAARGLITAEVVLGELKRVLEIKIRLPADVVEELITSLREHPVQPRPTSAPDLPVRDPDDVLILASALAAGADVLISGDPDLLDVAPEIEGIRILSPRGVWSLLRGFWR